MQNLSVIGNLGADAELRETNNSQFISFKVADTVRFTNQKGETKETTTWISCTLNGNGGNLLPYLKAGVKVFVQGRPSYRVYGSEKLRQMVCGVDLHVTTIELCGGTSDEVPSNLVDKDGLLYKPEKLFKIHQDDSNPISVLYSAKGNSTFDVSSDGFITKHKE